MSVIIKNPFLKLCQFSIVFGILTSFYHQILRTGDDVTRLLIPYRSEYAYALTGIFYILAIISGLILIFCHLFFLYLSSLDLSNFGIKTVLNFFCLSLLIV